jgi:hypothetical protein
VLAPTARHGRHRDSAAGGMASARPAPKTTKRRPWTGNRSDTKCWGFTLSSLDLSRWRAW